MGQGFYLTQATAAGQAITGILTLCHLGSNQWVGNGIFELHGTSNRLSRVSGAITLAGTLDNVRLTSANTPDTFDAGSVNIFYE